MNQIIAKLESLMINSPEEVDQWFEKQYAKLQPCFYNSVDIRHSGFKLAPVDTNCFPAGFNNLSSADLENASKKLLHYLERYYPTPKNIFLIPEFHTRNLRYLDNLTAIIKMLNMAGLEVKLGGPEEYINQLRETKHKLAEMAVVFMKHEQNLQTKAGEIADIVLTNNDLTAGVLALLADINQPVIPNIKLGWYLRRKSSHFTIYNKLAEKFAEQFGIDPFFITTQFHHCGRINFKEKQGIECLAINTDKIIHSLKAKYLQYGIDDQPYVYIKADNGTYGMGIMTASSGEEVYEMNKKLRNKMEVIKGGVVNEEVIIQEGVPTIDKNGVHVAESLVYLIAGEPVGYLQRVNSERGVRGNLNSSGMSFAAAEGLQPSYGLVARLASLATAQEVG